MKVAPSISTSTSPPQACEHPVLPVWDFSTLAGLLVEVVHGAATAAFTVTADLVRQAQGAVEPCAWISTARHLFYPPDLARTGVDLSSLLVVRVPEVTAVARSAEYLVRSGGFGLVVADFTSGSTRKFDSGFTARMVRLVRKHNAALVCITRGETLGSLVSLRVAPRRVRSHGGTEAALEVIKDRRHGSAPVLSGTVPWRG